MFYQSIRFKALFWYMVILAVTLLTFSLITYGGLYKSLYDDFDDLLSSRAEGIVDSINTYWHTGKTHFQGGSDPKTQPNSQALNDFLALARGWVEEKRKDSDLMSISVQILNIKGEKLVSSRIMPLIAALDQEDLGDILDGEEDFDTVKGETVSGKKTRFRVYSRPVIEEGKVAYIVQIAGPVDLLSVALANLRFILFGLLPLATILAGIPGVLLVRMTLSPVDRMIDTLRRITAENLKLKIHIPDTKDEMKRLADTFNDMIERIDRSFSSQQRFIQGISNELKTPMNTLKAELEAALKGDCPQDELRSVLARAEGEIGEFSKTIDNLLVLSTFDDDRIALEIRKVNLTRLIRQIADDVKMAAQAREIAVSFVYRDTIALDGDEAKLGRLFMNLLDNAIKYTNRKGNIAITVSREGEFAKVVVSDTGIGIPEDEMDYIFDRFYQAANARNAGRSFGLGLSSVKAIIEEHKGTISVESQYGKGSTFTVSLPLSYPG